MKTTLLLSILSATLLGGAPAVALAGAPMALAAEGGEGADSARGPLARERIVVNLDGRLTGPLIIRQGRIVKNAPYSAEVVNEHRTDLADGNQITNKSVGLTYRDSAGRTREESRNPSGAVTQITIADSSAGVRWILRPDAKTATKLMTLADATRLATDKARAGAEALHGAERDQVFVKRVERGEGPDGERVREDIRIRVAREVSGRAPSQEAERFGALVGSAFGDMKWSSRASTKDLGSKEIDGVKAQGKLHSYEIPAGEIGNRNAILVSTETWYAPDLQVTLLSKHSDPRSGERTYRLANLKREEPPAALFTVPSDYTVKDPLANASKADIK